MSKANKQNSLLPSLSVLSDLIRLELNICKFPAVLFSLSLCFWEVILQQSLMANFIHGLHAWSLLARSVSLDQVFLSDYRTPTNGAALSHSGYAISKGWDSAWVSQLLAPTLRDIPRNKSPVPFCLLDTVWEISLDLRLSSPARPLGTIVLTLRMLPFVFI